MILWNEKLIFTLNKIVKYLKRNNIGHILEYLANFYIDKHDLIFKMDDYAMDFSEDYVIDSSLITAGEFKLSFICELGFFIDIMRDKNMNRPIVSEDIYKYFSRMIRFGLENVYDIQIRNINSQEIYIMSMLKEIIISKYERNSVIKKGLKLKVKRDTITEYITYAYFITLELMHYKEENLSIHNLTSLILETEILDITILSKSQIKNILDVLDTKRRLYLRIFLVLAYNIVRNKYKNVRTFTKNIKFKNYEELLDKLTNPLIETMIFLSANKIIKEEYDF